jgi:hypothetical protein
MDILVNNFWVENIMDLMMMVGLVLVFMLLMFLFKPRDGVSWKEALDHEMGKTDEPNYNSRRNLH